MNPGTGAGQDREAVPSTATGVLPLVMEGLPASGSRRMDMGGWAWEEGICPKQGSTDEEGHEKLEQ